MTTNSFEVIIVGGSYAGLSAAMALGRSLRKVLIIDSGSPCNQQTPHSHNFITQDGVKPAEIAQKAREEVLQYPGITFLQDKAIRGEKHQKSFTITTESGNTYSAQKLIFATGIRDSMPSIPGFAACWGISVVHCPYCHGYELRGQKTAIWAPPEKAMHLAPMVKNLTDDLTILSTPGTDFSTEQLQQLKKHNIRLIKGEISAIEHNKGYIQRILFKDGNHLQLEGLYAALPFEQHSDIPMTLGCALNENGYIQVDPFKKTSVEGVFACGDNAGMMRSVANAVYTGNITGAMVNAELAREQF